MEVYQGRAFNHTNLQIKFSHRHVRYTIIILEEGKHPNPLCPDCDMFYPWKALNGWQPPTETCAQSQYSLKKNMSAGEAREWT